MRKTLLLFSTLLAFNLYSDEDCGETPKTKRFVLRHLEGSGIGYNRGYTSLDLFLASPETWGKSWVPFLDLRGHLFNNSKFATNAGIGGRYIATSRVWGANIYYDYRNSGRKHYNQVSGGLESLGRIWDFRINGYYPIGSKHSSLYNKSFDHFEGHCAILSAQREFSLKGFNAEVGAHIDHFKKAPLYLAAGPYYLNGEEKSSWGGELRARMDILEHIRLEGETSYDSIYKWTGRGQISAIIPFGKRAKVKKKNTSCHRAMILSRRAFQRVDRHEIIPIDDVKKTSKALDPTTCTPYNFIFVNNQCNSDGTAESPYPLLTTAFANSSPGDIIYVFPGDGSPYTTATTFALQNNQSLFGSAVSHPINTQFGLIRFPAQSPSYPQVTTDDADGTIVTLANNNEVAGMRIVGDDITAGIFGNNSSNIVRNTIRENWLEVSNTGGSSQAISIDNPAGSQATYKIFQNRITSRNSGTDTFDGIGIDNSGAFSSFIISHNRISDFFSISRVNGITLTSTGDHSKFHISYNQVSNSSSGQSDGIVVDNQGDFSSCNVFNNFVSKLFASDAQFAVGIMVADAPAGGSNSTYRIFNNHVSEMSCPNNAAQGISMGTVQDNSNILISNNLVSNLSSIFSTGILGNNLGGNNNTYTISGNRISNVFSSSIAGGSSDGINMTNSAGVVSFLITDNFITDVTGSLTPQGIFVGASLGGENCLVLIDNFAPPVIQLSNAASTFHLSPSSQGNNPSPVSSGNVIYNACSP